MKIVCVVVAVRARARVQKKRNVHALHLSNVLECNVAWHKYTFGMVHIATHLLRIFGNRQIRSNRKQHWCRSMDTKRTRKNCMQSLWSAQLNLYSVFLPDSIIHDQFGFSLRTIDRFYAVHRLQWECVWQSVRVVEIPASTHAFRSRFRETILSFCCLLKCLFSSSSICLMPCILVKEVYFLPCTLCAIISIE